MYKKVLAASIVAASLFLSGCGEESTSCRFNVQADLDEGNFDSAITALNGSCKDAFTASDRYFNLASAYMGKSGFGAIDVVNMVLDSSDSNDSAFSALTRSVSENKKESSLEYLAEAKTYFLLSANPDANKSSVTTAVCDVNSSDTRIDNACFYVGFAQTFQATTTVTYLTKDVDGLVDSINDNNKNETPIDMKASLDALSWATGATSLPNGSTITASAITIEGKAYKHLVVLQNGESFYRLADASAPSTESSTLVTNGYCDIDGNKSNCEGIEKADGSIIENAPVECYACPVGGDNNSTNVANLLVNALNGGTDVLSSVTDDEDIHKSIDEFVQDITGDSNAKAGDVNVTLEQVLNYLNK
jgi:hypothetical protein